MLKQESRIPKSGAHLGPSGRAARRHIWRRYAAVSVSCGFALGAAQVLTSLDAASPAAATTSGVPLGIGIASYAGDAVSATPSESAQAGSDVTYRVTVSNTGPSAQTNVSVPVSLPANFSLGVTTIGSSVGTPSAGTGTINWAIPSLTSGAAATLTYTETTDAPAGIESDATTAAVTSDQSTTATTTTESVAVIPAADLSVSISDGVDSIAPGAAETYTITLTNNGPSDATNATVTEGLNSGFVAIGGDSSLPDPVFTDLGGGQFDWTGIDLPNGASATFDLFGTAPTSLASGDAYVALATVSPSPGEIDTDPVSTATDSDLVSGPVSSGPLGLAIATYDGDAVTTTLSASALAGTDVTYEATVTNTTADAQTNVTVPVDLPANFTLDSTLEASDGSTANSGGVVTWSIGSLPGGASDTLVYTETTDAPATQEMDVTTASATSDQSTTPIAASASVDVIPASDLSISVTDGMDSIVPGGTDTYTITLTNNGPSAATNTMVSDTLNGGFVATVAVSPLSGTTFSEMGTDQFEWSGINLAGGTSATFILGGSAATTLEAGSALVNLVTGTLPVGEVDTDQSTNAVDADTVIAAPQSIAFTPPTSAIAGQSATLAATGGGSGNPVVFSVDPSSGAGVCSVTGTDGTTLDYAAAGTCVVDANQGGNASYAAAPTVTASITVEQVPVFTSATPLTTVPAGQAYTYTFAASGTPAPAYSFAPGAPTWLAIDASTGAVSGTPPRGRRPSATPLKPATAPGRQRWALSR